MLKEWLPGHLRSNSDLTLEDHQSAIAMANVALEESKNPEIRGIAKDIVRAQKREISQMLRWRARWYPGD